jgi:hypothetical protein
MMDVLVDSDVLLDVFTEDPRWYGRSAAVLGIPLLTRDAARCRTYFPRLELIVP